MNARSDLFNPSTILSLMKYFIDGIKDDGSPYEGSIAWPAEDAIAVIAEMRAEHPTWQLEMNLLEGTP